MASDLLSAARDDTYDASSIEVLERSGTRT